MKASLAAGLTHRLSFVVPDSKTVPMLYPESPEFASMPHIFATGFMVGLMEWACMELMRPHLDQGEGSLGIGIDVTHVAATPPGFTVSVDVEVLQVDNRKLTFMVSAHDGMDLIGAGRHERAVVNWERFNARVADKASNAKAKA